MSLKPILFLLLISFSASSQTGTHSLTQTDTHSPTQTLLDKRITVNLRQKALSKALNEIAHKGDFRFSYNTGILKGDSLVTIKAEDITIRQVLDQLLGPNYDYSETGKYIIILPRTNAPPVKSYSITGYVKDELTKQKLADVSIYESNQLVSTLTDTNGFFRIKLKDKYSHVVLVVSKQFYRDTLLFIRPGRDQQVDVSISYEKVSDLTPLIVTNKVEKTWLAKLFLSYKTIKQSLNLSNFLSNKPVQVSLIPGLGTHGRMEGQVVNKLSLNLIGGYAAGMKGVELAGIFNIDKKSVQYIQAAGLFNIVGGKVSGVQLAGLHNQDLDSAEGVIAAGLTNYVAGNVKGVQIAGIGNNCQDTVKGVQVSGIINRTKVLKGLQIGLINITDTSSGVMIGLLNIVRHGMHQFSISSNEMLPLTLSYKTGSHKLYSIVNIGFDPTQSKKIYGYGFGLGNQLNFSKHFALNTEFTETTLIESDGHNLPSVSRLQSTLRIQPGKGSFAVNIGPSISLAGASSLPRSGYHTFAVGNSIGWFGGVIEIIF